MLGHNTRVVQSCTACQYMPAPGASVAAEYASLFCSLVRLMVASPEAAGTRQGLLTVILVGMQFLSRPFVVGDRVELSSGGGERVMVGVIERVDPIRTIIRTDASLPVTIPNKVLSRHA